MQRFWLWGFSSLLGTAALAQVEANEFLAGTGTTDLGAAIGAPAPTNAPPVQAAPNTVDPQIAVNDAAREEERPRAPTPLNAFQRFIQASTGQSLPLYGANYFLAAPTTFAPVKNTAVPGEYAIGPGDEIVVRLTGVIDLNLRLVVDGTGRITLPKVGAVSVVGVRVAELETFLTRKLSKSFSNFSLSATLGSLRSIDVYVVGEARQPGKYTVSSLSSLVNALFVTGGPSGNGSMRHVQLLRAGVLVAEIDLYQFINAGRTTTGDVEILAGDVLFYPAAGPRVALLGDVHLPAVFELKAAGDSLGQLLTLAGGVPVTAMHNLVTLERIDSQEKVARTLMSVALDEVGRQTPLRDGDILRLFPISPEFANAVTLRGNVAVPLRSPYREGMRVRDLIPNREALITSDYYRRKNLAVLFDAPPSDEPPPPGNLKEMLDPVNWEYAVIERLSPSALVTDMIPFNLGKAVLEGDQTHNLLLQPGDVVTVFSEKDVVSPQARKTRLVRIQGEVSAPGIYQLQPGETLTSLITRVGGLTNQAYIFGVALQRASIREAQSKNLEKLVRRLDSQMDAHFAERRASADPSQTALIAAQEQLARKRIEKLAELDPDGRLALDLDPVTPVLPAVILEGDDAIFVPARPSFVSVLGAVQNENSFLWKADRTAAQYLEIAGPLTSADLDRFFVLRADGTVHSRGTGFLSWFGNRTNGLVLEPGDIVMVPERFDIEPAFMRGLRDWTQILANFGIGVAGITSLLR